MNIRNKKLVFRNAFLKKSMMNVLQIFRVVLMSEKGCKQYSYNKRICGKGYPYSVPSLPYLIAIFVNKEFLYDNTT